MLVQPTSIEACLRAYPPLSSLGPLQGVFSPDVTRTFQGDAGSPGAVAEGGHSTNLHLESSITNNFDSLQIHPSCNICTYTHECCDHRQCKLCNIYDNNHYFISTNTGRIFHTLSNQNLSCNTGNVIYLITCNFCKLQYVGETSKTLKIRFNNHRSAGKNINSNKILYEHFNSYPCNGYGYKVKIIQKMAGSGHLENGKLDPEATQHRLHAEESWIQKLQTLYPYGLNDRFRNKDFRNKEDNDFISRNYFSKLDSQYKYDFKKTFFKM